jgi:hypothetical protein
MEETMEISKNLNQMVLNICFAYSHREEIEFARQQAWLAFERSLSLKQGRSLNFSGSSSNLSIHPKNMTMDILKGMLYTCSCDHSESNPCANCLQSNCTPDMLLRTSGETRLSDFLLLQLSHASHPDQSNASNSPSADEILVTPQTSSLVFTDTLWPDLTMSEIGTILLQYQMSASAQRTKKSQSTRSPSRSTDSSNHPSPTTQSQSKPFKSGPKQDLANLVLSLRNLKKQQFQRNMEALGQKFDTLS